MNSPEGVEPSISHNAITCARVRVGHPLAHSKGKTSESDHGIAARSGGRGVTDIHHHPSRMCVMGHGRAAQSGQRAGPALRLGSSGIRFMDLWRSWQTPGRATACDCGVRRVRSLPVEPSRCGRGPSGSQLLGWLINQLGYPPFLLVNLGALLWAEKLDWRPAGPGRPPGPSPGPGGFIGANHLKLFKHLDSES